MPVEAGPGFRPVLLASRRNKAAGGRTEGALEALFSQEARVDEICSTEGLDALAAASRAAADAAAEAAAEAGGEAAGAS